MNSDKPAALVTGAATGIGRSAAIALAKNGYDVVVNYSRSEDAAKITAREAEAAGAKTMLCRADVSDDASVRAMLAATEKEFGRLDVLINNAGTTVDVEPKNFEEMTVDAWNRVFSVNVLGLFLVTRAATPLLKKIVQRLRRQHVQHRRPASERAALALCREQSGGGQLDQDPRQRARPADPRQRRRARLDRR